MFLYACYGCRDEKGEGDPSLPFFDCYSLRLIKVKPGL